MFGSLWNFLKRHKKKLLLASFVTGGGAVLYNYAKERLLEFEKREAHECVTHARRQHHFDSNQRTCNMTVVSMLPNLREAIFKLFETEAILEELKQNPSNKIELWQDMKTMSFARAVTVVYGCSLMPLFLRVQLNIIGGYMYLDNLFNQNGLTEDIVMVPPTIQERYLSLIKNFFTHGLTDLAQLIQKAVSQEISSISLKEKLSVHNIEAIINQIRHRIENGDAGKATSYPFFPVCDFLLPQDQQVYPPKMHVSREDHLYNRLVTETRDVIESQDFQKVLKVCLDKGSSKLLDYIAEHYRVLQAAEKDDPHLHEFSMPMAKLVPVVDGSLYKLCSNSPNPLIQELLLLDQTRSLAANIYEAFSQHGDMEKADRGIEEQLKP